MIVGFTGSREYLRVDLVENFVGALANKYPGATVISGGRGHVDCMAEMAGVNNRLAVISYRPTEKGVEVWQSEGGAELELVSRLLGHDGFVRNCFFRNEFIASAERVVGFWDLESRGTADTLSRARGKGRPRTVYGPDGRQLTEEEVDMKVYEVLG